MNWSDLDLDEFKDLVDWSDGDVLNPTPHQPLPPQHIPQSHASTPTHTSTPTAQLSHTSSAPRSTPTHVNSTPMRLAHGVALSTPAQTPAHSSPMQAAPAHPSTPAQVFVSSNSFTNTSPQVYTSSFIYSILP